MKAGRAPKTGFESLLRMNRPSWRGVRIGSIGIAVAAIVAVTALYLRGPQLHRSSDRAESHSGADSSPSDTMDPQTVHAAAVTAEASAGPAPDWAALYYGDSDAYDLISRAAAKALSGDGEAAYFVALSARKCFFHALAPWNSANPEEAFAAQWSKFPEETDAIANDRKAMRKCLRYLRGDAFSALPPKPGGYEDWRFWLNIAYESAYPPALTLHAWDAMPSTASTASAATSVRVQVQGDVQKVLLSGHPAAIFDLGLVFELDTTDAPSTKGLVVRLAACELGYDCTSNNPALDDFFGCVQRGTCPVVYDFQDLLRQVITPSEYAAMYAQARELAEAVQRGDESALQTFSRLGFKQKH